MDNKQKIKEEKKQSICQRYEGNKKRIMDLCHQSPGKRRETKKVLKENNGWKLPKFGKRHKLTDSKGCTNRIKLKKSIQRHLIYNFWKTKNKENIFKVASEKWQQICHQKLWKPRRSGTTVFTSWKKRTVKLKSYTQWFRNEGESRCSQLKNN